MWRDPTVDVRDERYEVNHCSETEKCQTRWKDDGVGWSGREYKRQLIDQKTKAGELLHGDGISNMVM